LYQGGIFIGNSAYRQIRHAALHAPYRISYNGTILLKDLSEVLMNMSPFLSISHSCDETLQWTNKQLITAGLRPVQTFDLHTARLGLHDCSCPNHGTEECDCQMVVLLVYGKAEEPVTLILHGNDGQTWLSMADTPRQRSNARLTNEIQQALEVQASEPNTP
jgi:hypothetical protein